MKFGIINSWANKSNRLLWKNKKYGVCASEPFVTVAVQFLKVVLSVKHQCGGEWKCMFWIAQTLLSHHLYRFLRSIIYDLWLKRNTVCCLRLSCNSIKMFPRHVCIQQQHFCAVHLSPLSLNVFSVMACFVFARSFFIKITFSDLQHLCLHKDQFHL